MDKISLPARFEETNTSDPDHIVSEVRTGDQESDAARTIHYVNSFGQENGLPLPSMGYGTSVSNALSSQSRVSVWGQNELSNINYVRPPLTYWGGHWGEGVLYDSAVTEKVDEGAMWAQNETDFGSTSKAACFADGTSDAPLYQSFEARDLNSMDLTASQLGTLDQIVSDSSRNRSSLPYSLEQEAVSSQSKGMSSRSKIDGASYTNLDLSAQAYNALDSVRPLQQHQVPGNRFQSEDLERLETGHAGSTSFRRKEMAGHDTGVAMSNELVLERIGKFTLDISRALSTSNSDNTLTASAHLQSDCRYHPDSSPLVVVGSSNISDHRLPVNSFENTNENVNHAQRLTAYFGNPCDNFPRMLDQQQGNDVTGSDHEVSDMSSLLMPRSSVPMTDDPSTSSVGGTHNFTDSLSRNWGTAPGQLDATHPDHRSPTLAGDRNYDDLVELVAHPLEQTPYLRRVKNSTSSYLGVSSSMCTVPVASEGGKGIRGINFPNHQPSLAEAKLYDICSKMRSQWQLGCIALAHR